MVSHPPAIFGLGTAGGDEFFIENRGDGGSQRQQEVGQAFLARAVSDLQIGGAQTPRRAPPCRSYSSTSPTSKPGRPTSRSTRSSRYGRRSSLPVMAIPDTPDDESHDRIDDELCLLQIKGLVEGSLRGGWRLSQPKAKCSRPVIRGVQQVPHLSRSRLAQMALNY